MNQLIKSFLYKVAVVPLMFTALVSQAQNNLKEIPDPDPALQMEKFKVADGYEVTLFASDPMVVKPIQMNWDADGRLWVASSIIYPHMRTGEEANDKIYVLEDTDGDGVADKSTIFAEGLLMPTGILPGDGGVYVANSTEVLFLKDTDGDGKADHRQVLLTGFGTGDTHHLIHTFRWGPEGLLYFAQSIYIYSHVETPWGVRRLEGGGVWQLRPENRKLEVYAKGLVNPWGLQFDRWGQSFLTDGAGGEGINYAFPGATFVTAPGAERIIRGLNPGQPKHSGLDIVSGRHMADWQGDFITNDFRANRINRFTVEEQGSGFATKLAEDLLWADHVSFRPVDITMGPDGAIYVADWYNPIIQHGEVDFHDPRRDQQHGRIWRITKKGSPLVEVPKLSQASLDELFEALKSPEDWTRLQAKLVIKQKNSGEVLPKLQEWIKGLDTGDSQYEHHLLEALWVHQLFDHLNQPLLTQLLNAKSHNARAAAMRFLQFYIKEFPNAQQAIEKGAADTHPRVRLEAVVALRQLQSPDAATAALSVLDKPMDEFLDFALWETVRELESSWLPALKNNPTVFGDAKKTVYALKSINNPEAGHLLVQLYQKKQVPEEYNNEVLSAIARRGETGDLDVLFDLAVNNSLGGSSRSAQLAALEEAARQRKIKPSKELGRIVGFLENEDERIVGTALRLIGYWDMENQVDRLVKIAQADKPNHQKAALAALAAMSNNKGQYWLTELASNKYAPQIRVLATGQLASKDAVQASGIAVNLLKQIPANVDATELFSAFLSRREGIGALGQALSENKIPESAAIAGRKAMQQLPFYFNRLDEVTVLRDALEASGGVLPPEKMPQQLHPQQLSNLAQEVRATADPVLGEAIYRRANLVCQTCHAVGGAGGKIGPDLSSLGTSSPIDNIIQSLLAPNESIKEGYELQRVVKKDGSSVMGYLAGDGASAVVIRNVAGIEESVPKDQIEVHESVPGSLMPPALTASLDRKEFVDLVGYLSKLGQSGDFRVPNSLFVRRWRAINGNKEWQAKVKQEGISQVIKEDAKNSLLPVYSQVGGAIPLGELPVFEAGSNRYSAVQFEIEVLTEGNVDLLLDSTEGITAWAGQKPLPLNQNGGVVRLPQGIHSFTLAVDRNVRKDGPLSVQIQDASTSPAQVRLVMGQ
jgi:putative heme-binding domain-containing protein